MNGQRDIFTGDKGTGKTALYRILMKRSKTLPALASTEVVTAFNLTGNPIFQQLLTIPQQTEGLYIAFWKTYFLALIGNWILEHPTLVDAPSVRRVEAFIERCGLKATDTTPKGIFSKVIQHLERKTIKSAELGVSLVHMIPMVKPKLEFGDEPAPQHKDFFGIDYSAGLHMLNGVLEESGRKFWIALDRLDEAFQGYPNIEVPALRALLRTYLDFSEYSEIRLKLFLRKDLARKILAGGFVNMTHINDKRIEITWDNEELKHLLVARIRDSTFVVDEMKLADLDDDAVFSKFFPDKVAQGENQSTTWNWLIARITDGNDVIAPRNLIDVVERAREEQLRSENRSPRDYVEGRPIFDPISIKKAHRSLSQTRVDDTLLAEAADLAPLLEKFRNKKAEYDRPSLALLLGVSIDELEPLIRQLRDIGFLERVGENFRVPALYRYGLGIKQGKATLSD